MRKRAGGRRELRVKDDAPPFALLRQAVAGRVRRDFISCIGIMSNVPSIATAAPRPTLLILGGTGEGFALAKAATEQLGGAIAGLRVITSMAGRVASLRQPAGELRVGGFRGVDAAGVAHDGIEGLARYLRQEQVGAVIDATHPFAARMGWNAAAACVQAAVPLLRLERPAWQAGPGDDWEQVTDWVAAAEALRGRARRVFLTVGRQELAPFATLDEIWFLIRSVEAPDPALRFARSELLLARGPFHLEDERALLKEHRIDTIVCKNSGGGATDAKLAAAREMGLHVVMLARPARPDVAAVPTVAAAVDWARDVLAKS
jgi:precorrin-6A/cobalt-precorrin-6A reductase